jgi:hypothetical protein
VIQDPSLELDLYRLPKRLKLASVITPSDADHYCRNDLDSHADTCAFGKKGAVKVYDTGASVSVEPFIQALGSISEIPIVTSAVAYDNPIDNRTYILFFHQSLWIEMLETNLLSPFQQRDGGIKINETPLQHEDSPDRTTVSHSIYTMPPPV